MQSVRNVVGYIAYFSFVFCFSLFALPFALLFFPWKRHHRILIALMHKALWLFTYHFLPFIGVIEKVKVEGEMAHYNERAVFVANHQSWLDGLLLLGVLPSVTPVMKGSYARSILYRQFIRWTNFITIDPGSTESAKEALEQARTHLSQNKQLLVFPEGTRSSSGHLRGFKPLAFKIAKETESPIIPVTIMYAPLFMSKELKTFFPGKRVAVTVTFHPALSTDMSSSELLATAHRTIQKKLKENHG